MDSLVNIAEVMCFLGLSLSALIASRLAKIEELTFLNKMFLSISSLIFLLAQWNHIFCLESTGTGENIFLNCP